MPASRRVALLEAVSRFLARGLARLYCGLAVRGRRGFPRRGGVLLVANHTSLLDPPLLGCLVPRHCAYMARASLFANPWFAAVIRTYGAFPVDRGAGDRQALRAATERLRAGDVLLMFPEGTRGDGTAVGPFQRGFLLLVRQAGVPVVPVGIWGLHRVLPRRARFPRPANVRVCFGAPLPAEEALELGADGIRTRVVELVEAAASRGPARGN